MIYAALDGIENNLELPEENSCSGEKLPSDISEATDLAEKSDFLKKYIPEKILSVMISELPCRMERILFSLRQRGF